MKDFECMKDLKILISTRYTIFESEGTSIRAKRIMSIIKNSFKVQIITTCKKPCQSYNMDNIFLITPKNTKIWSLKIIPTIWINNFDLIICENDWMGFPIYWIFSKFLKFKIIFEAHGVLSKEAKNWGTNFVFVKFLQIIEKFCIKNSDLVIALSKEIREEYKNYNDNIKLVPVFIDKIKVKPVKSSEKIKKIGIIGPFGSKRNMYYAPDFIHNNLNSFNKKINFKIIGKCNKDYKSHRIEKMGYISSFEEYMNYISTMDAIVVIEKRETSGPLNKILESMACGTPVFTTPKGAIGLDNIKNGNNIIISNEIDLVHKINKIIFDENQLLFISNNAKELYKNYYSQKVNKKKIISSIKSLY